MIRAQEIIQKARAMGLKDLSPHANARQVQQWINEEERRRAQKLV